MTFTFARPVSATAKPAAKPAKASNVITLDRRPAERIEHFQARQAAANGKLPAAPDFSAATHASYRKRLAAIVAMVEAGDIKGLQADDTQPVSSSRVILCRYRDNCILALQAIKRAKAARAKRQQRAKKAA